MSKIVEFHLRLKFDDEVDLDFNEVCEALQQLAGDEIVDDSQVLDCNWNEVIGDEDKEDEEFTDDLLH